MDLTKFASELEKIGLTATEEQNEHFKDIKSLTLPFKIASIDYHGIIANRLLQDANYIYKSKRSITEDELRKTCKIVPNNGLEKRSKIILEWMISNIDKLQVVNKGSAELINNRFSQTKDLEDRYEVDTKYGLCVLAYYIEYSRLTLNLSLDFREYSILQEYKGAGFYDFLEAEKTEEGLISILDRLSEVSEFIPIYMGNTTGCQFNDFYDRKDDYVSSYGENILNSKFYMERLTKDGFFENGGKINPKVWYYIIIGKNGNCYLKRDLQKSPRLNNRKEN